MGLFRFGARSQHRLRTCHPDIRRVMQRALSWGVIDFAILDGFRDEPRQTLYFETGKSKVQWPDGQHNVFPSNAVDIAPWVDGALPWEDSRYWYQLAGVIQAAAKAEGVDLRWGGDWDSDGDFDDQTFDDLGHFERPKN